VGFVHGFAGSAAVVFVVLSEIHEVWLGFVYFLVFGLGTMFGMVLVMLFVVVSLCWVGVWLSCFTSALSYVVGAVSIVVGFWFAHCVVVVERVFTVLG
jgi:hypothetical protein